MINNYYNIVCEAKEKIKKYIDTIYQVSGDELLLELEHYNLLSSKNNCIETSTATGFIMEEYISSKLSIYTSKFKGNKNEIVIERLPDSISTINSSYDCFALYKNILFLINIKVEKGKSKNDAVAGINILYNDYVINEPKQDKSYLILKTHYSFDNSKMDNERKIKINGTEIYALEEINFSEGHLQDHRNWTENFNKNSGRLLVTKKWRETYRQDIDRISYKTTKHFIEQIYNSNM